MRCAYLKITAHNHKHYVKKGAEYANNIFQWAKIYSDLLDQACMLLSLRNTTRVFED
jgi:hypothetical protein